MIYDTIEELTLELALYPNKKIDILKDCARKCKYGWFTVAKDGNCALFDDNGDIDDLGKVRSIDEYMVKKDISKIIIPENVVKIKDYAFCTPIHQTSQLTDVVLPSNLKYIGSHAFFCCKKISSIDIPDSVINIDDSAFAMCYSLENIKLPNKLKSLYTCTFQECTSLKHITIPRSVHYINGSAFANCSSLKEVFFEGKTLEEVKSMVNYPFDIAKSAIKAEK